MNDPKIDALMNQLSVNEDNSKPRPLEILLDITLTFGTAGRRQRFVPEAALQEAESKNLELSMKLQEGNRWKKRFEDCEADRMRSRKPRLNDSGNDRLLGDVEEVP